MNSWDKRYSDRVQLLVDILPVLAKETRFALKGGTAINLFEHDLPRLSVDIDLTWLPVQDFEADVAAISAALEQLAETLRARPLQLQVQTSGGANTGGITRLICSRGRARVQIETTPVMRGAVHPVRTMVVQPEVGQAFGFASTQVLDFADLYAGKLAAALSRQHPRDLFDIGLLLEDERADATLWRTFLVYLICSPKPAWELLAPREPVDFEAPRASTNANVAHTLSTIPVRWTSGNSRIRACTRATLSGSLSVRLI
ncbi:nucleotidyl transferase AbiEii/AbiGii toxin family protein [Ectothiorhodospira variabilis]|uniref:nucleotidyl transferase AbiEii/AbiGii toxin family protein n=1 Tax=Ectothiorhodospira variabilis TaxID=505694 RepID=UPI001EFA76CD|nr:nucleotidyl transferase AbiEii/AbiGii toxin family protein [Ectothiorhodospira variabilis]MCG5493116.1 nucleotidyl transferase AbiEii/AbiGii toxin family protein [Ectothiorhodospira variabilis]MCG5502445.1 nucleotidyl transferase AbiEii/AbiGii toxin family protein [Ectothiorhodospira variabilis]MCG5505789.1 nucleotidyl transferase AbiEii/AbiGii toxin family protein [Ectothiorhodospira variabilis]